MNAEVFGLALGSVWVLGSAFGYWFGRKTDDRYNEGLLVGAGGGRVLADMVARELINRPHWPLDRRANVQRWKELGRREAYAIAADKLCKRFNIQTPERKDGHA